MRNLSIAAVLAMIAACGGASTLEEQQEDAGGIGDPPAYDASTTTHADATIADSSTNADSSIDADVDVIADAALEAEASTDAATDADADAAPPVDTVAQVSVGGNHTCFRFTSGLVRCVGLNSEDASPTRMYPKLGDGVIVHAGCPVAGADCSLKPVLVLGLTDAVDVRAGAYHTCAVKPDATVVCWGQNDVGQIGDGTKTARPTPVAVAGLTDVVQLAVGANVTCARKSTGALLCWGHNSRGQMGDGTLIDRTTPKAVPGMTDVIDVSIGDGSVCAIRTGGAVACWGANRYGSLGDGVRVHSTCLGFDCSKVPVAVPGIADATSLSTGSNHACVIRTGGTMACWGGNFAGPLGDGIKKHAYPAWTECANNDCSPLPVTVLNMDNAASIATGAGHTCAIRTTGQVSCWGESLYGTLGNPRPAVDMDPQPKWQPTDVMGLTDALSISGHDHDYFVMRPAERLSSWGRNFAGSLSLGTVGVTYVPTDAKPQ